MDRRRDTSNVVAIVEAAHRVAESPGAWLDGVVDAGRALLADELGLVATIMRRTADRMQIEAFAEIDNPFGWLKQMQEYVCESQPPAAFEAYCGQGKPVRRLADIRSKVSDTGVDIGVPFLQKGVFSDFTMLVGHPREDVVIVVAALERSKRAAAPHRRRRLHQVVLHLENAARLFLDVHHEVAVVRPDGRIAHADPPHSDRSTGARLSRHVVAIEGVRSRALRRASDEGVDAWPALANGTYSLMERVDRDGRRDYLAFENPVVTRRHRALTLREQSVIELSARGMSGKWLSYSLGISEGAVSEALSTAAAKLGFPNRFRAVAAVAALQAPASRPRESHLLTGAELAVFELVCQGLSNAEVAARRGRSVRTIANQVASLLRKTGAASRRALPAHRGCPEV